MMTTTAMARCSRSSRLGFSALFLATVACLCFFPAQTTSFWLQSLRMPGYYLTIDGGGTYKLAQATGPSPPNMDYSFVPMSLTNTELNFLRTGTSMKCSKMCLGLQLYAGSINAVTQLDCNPGSLSQYWINVPAPPESQPQEGYVWLQNLVTGQCMTAETWTTTSYVDAYDCVPGAQHQLWKHWPEEVDAGGSFVANQGNPGKCLRVNGGSPRSSAGTSIEPCISGAYYQRFNASLASPRWGQFGLQNKASGLCVNATPGSAAVVKEAICSFTARNQQWLRGGFPNENLGGFRSYFVELATGGCLTMDPNNLKSINMMPCIQGNANQQWEFGGIP